MKLEPSANLVQDQETRPDITHNFLREFAKVLRGLKQEASNRNEAEMGEDRKAKKRKRKKAKRQKRQDEEMSKMLAKTSKQAKKRKNDTVQTEEELHAPKKAKVDKPDRNGTEVGEDRKGERRKAKRKKSKKEKRLEEMRKMKAKLQKVVKERVEELTVGEGSPKQTKNRKNDVSHTAIAEEEQPAPKKAKKEKSDRNVAENGKSKKRKGKAKRRRKRGNKKCKVGEGGDDPRVDDETPKQTTREKKKKKKNEAIVQVQEEHSGSEPDDPDPLEDHFPTGDEVADDDVSVFIGEEELNTALDRLGGRNVDLQKRNKAALAMLRSSPDICKKLKGLVPQACLKLPSKPRNDKEKDHMLHNLFGVPKISKEEFPTLSKVLNWILTEESFVVPSLNISKVHCFKQARGEQRESLMRKVPGFRSGRFMAVEDAVILSRLHSLQAALDLSEDATSQLLIDANNHRREKGKQRKFRHARVIIGAYLGRPMLKYRLAIDVYFCFVKLANAHLRAEMFNPEKRERIAAYLKRRKRFCNRHNCQCLSDLGLLYLRNCSDLEPILKATKEYEVCGSFSIMESVNMLEMAMDQRETSDIEELKSENLDWGRIAGALKRQAYSVRVHYDSNIWTPLARLLSGGGGGASVIGDSDVSVIDGWKEELCRAILADETVRERRAIRWQEMSGRFPDVALNAMLQFVGNCVKKPDARRKHADGTTLTFRESIQSYVDKRGPQEGEMRRSRKAFTARLSRVGDLWTVYCKRREQYAAEDNKLLQLNDI